MTGRENVGGECGEDGSLEGRWVVGEGGVGGRRRGGGVGDKTGGIERVKKTGSHLMARRGLR